MRACLPSHRCVLTMVVIKEARRTPTQPVRAHSTPRAGVRRYMALHKVVLMVGIDMCCVAHDRGVHARNHLMWGYCPCRGVMFRSLVCRGRGVTCCKWGNLGRATALPSLDRCGLVLSSRVWCGLVLCTSKPVCDRLIWIQSNPILSSLQGRPYHMNSSVQK